MMAQAKSKIITMVKANRDLSGTVIEQELKKFDLAKNYTDEQFYKEFQSSWNIIKKSNFINSAGFFQCAVIALYTCFMHGFCIELFVSNNKNIFLTQEFAFF